MCTGLPTQELSDGDSDAEVDMVISLRANRGRGVRWGAVDSELDRVGKMRPLPGPSHP